MAYYSACMLIALTGGGGIIAEGVFLEGQGCYDGMLCSCLGMLHCCAGQFWPCVTVPHGALDNLGGVSLCRADRHGTGSTCAVRHLAHTAHPPSTPAHHSHSIHFLCCVSHCRLPFTRAHGILFGLHVHCLHGGERGIIAENAYSHWHFSPTLCLQS